jgi:hypothetical protein
MAIKVYTCMVVSRRTDEFIAFGFFKDRASQPYSLEQVERLIDKYFLKKKYKRSGKIFVYDHNAEDSAWA